MSNYSRRQFLKGVAALTAASVTLPLNGFTTRRALAEDRQWTVTGQAVPSLAAFDQAMQKYMQPRNIPSGALTVTRRGQLVLARGYSWSADRAEIVEPTSLFRIASVTKPFTSAAVMTLVQANKLQLSQKIVDVLDMQPPKGRKVDPRLNTIIVQDLLQHLGGWDRDTAFDPMFYDDKISKALGVKLPISTQDIVTYMNGQPLQHDPGSTYVYSNYGYCILGLVIEKISGQPYDRYVREAVLKPLGIKSMVPGRSLLRLRALNEVKYYTEDTGLYPSMVDDEPKVPIPYGTFNLENMDAHGRWAASAVDLMRFATSFDKPGTSPILSQESIQTTFAPPAIGPNKDGTFYACGWSMTPAGNRFNTWHNGSLPGTTTYMVRRVDGLNWAMLFNQRDDASKLSYDDIDSAIHQAADSIRQWPDHNLFEQYS